MKKYLAVFLLLFTMFSLCGHDNNDSGDLSADKFFEIFTVKLNESQKNLTFAHKKNHLARIGTETINGEISGTLFYTIKIKGFGASVIMRYTNFCDEEGWIFDGEINITSDVKSNGKYGGTITVTGDFPATVCYDNVKMTDSKPSSGEYIIIRNNKQEKIAYPKYMEICEAYGLEN